MANFLKGWVDSGIVNFTAGFVVGWIVFKRPQWVDSAIAWVRGKLHI